MVCKIKHGENLNENLHGNNATHKNKTAIFAKQINSLHCKAANEKERRRVQQKKESNTFMLERLQMEVCFREERFDNYQHLTSL
jgi:hypothetical protein